MVHREENLMITGKPVKTNWELELSHLNSKRSFVVLDNLTYLFSFFFSF